MWGFLVVLHWFIGTCKLQHNLLSLVFNVALQKTPILPNFEFQYLTDVKWTSFFWHVNFSRNTIIWEGGELKLFRPGGRAHGLATRVVTPQQPFCLGFDAHTSLLTWKRIYILNITNSQQAGHPQRKTQTKEVLQRFWEETPLESPLTPHCSSTPITISATMMKRG
jgi:hypothetical protein